MKLYTYNFSNLEKEKIELKTNLDAKIREIAKSEEECEKKLELADRAYKAVLENAGKIEMVLKTEMKERNDLIHVMVLL